MSMRKRLAVAAAAAALLATAACGGGGPSPNQQAAESLVAETTFDVKTLDPQRQFESTGSLVDRHLYQSALEFADGDFSTPVDGLCSYEISDDAKTVTLTLLDTGAKFSDGSEVTVDDIVFSYQRLQGLKGNPSFFLDGVTVTKVDDKTITLVSEQPNPVLPFVLPNKSMGIINADVVKANGGTTGEDDAAEEFLNTNSQGSGPYMVESYDPAAQIVLKANPHYNGKEPKFKRVVLRNVQGETQKVNVESGQSDIALDLSPDQIAQLDQATTKVASNPATSSLSIFMTASDKVHPQASDPKFQEAIRYALDYDKMLALAGDGGQRLASPVPNLFVGHVPPEQAPQKDLAKAKKLLAEAGYDGEEVPFLYASDQTVGGIPLSQLAQIIEASLKQAGVNLKLKPAPSATQLDAYRSGKEAMGLMYWGADYPDPENYLVFVPGGSIGKRSQWEVGDAPEFDKLAKAAKEAGPDEREAAYLELYTKLGQSSPFVPLLQPMRSVVVSTKKVNDFVSNSDTVIRFEDVT